MLTADLSYFLFLSSYRITMQTCEKLEPSLNDGYGSEAPSEDQISIGTGTGNPIPAENAGRLRRPLDRYYKCEFTMLTQSTGNLSSR